MAGSLNTGSGLLGLPHNTLQSGSGGKQMIYSTQCSYTSKNYQTKGVSVLSGRDKPAHERLVGCLPGAGCGICGRRPPLTVLLGGVVHSVTGQKGEDEVWRLSAEIWLTFKLTGLPHPMKALIINTYREQLEGQEKQAEAHLKTKLLSLLLC